MPPSVPDSQPSSPPPPAPFFSWRALILAPLVYPFILSALLTLSAPGKNAFTGFLFVFLLGSLLSYAITIFLFLPCWFLVSKLTPLTAIVAGIVGTALGALSYIPIVWQSYRSSGDDSGPPSITFGQYVRQFGFGWDFFVVILAGLVTALLYWFLARRSLRNNQPAQSFSLDR